MQGDVRAQLDALVANEDGRPSNELAHLVLALAAEPLPEDLRSGILMSYGRGEVANYHRNLLSAVEIWRRSGVWRVPFDES
jgi:hypothetical protein